MKSRQTIARELKRLNGMLARSKPGLEPEAERRIKYYRDALRWAHSQRGQWLQPSKCVLNVYPRKGER